jgi:hypothetical protein
VPFTGESPLAVLVSHLTLPAPRASEVLPELPVELDEPILAMLHKEPSGRPATAGAAIAALVAAAERAGISIPAGMPHLPRPRELPETTPSTFSPRPLTPEPSGHSDARRDLIGSDTQPSAPARPATLPMLAVLVLLALLVAYLGRSALDGPKGVTPSASASPASVASSQSATPPGGPPAVGGAAPGSAAPTEGASLNRAPEAPETPAAPARSSLDPPPAEHPEHVHLTLRGAPPGARVQRGDDVLGEASKPVRLPFGRAPLELTVTAPGHEPHSLSVVPDRDGESEVKLRRRARPKPSSDIPSDLESPF